MLAGRQQSSEPRDGRHRPGGAERIARQSTSPGAVERDSGRGSEAVDGGAGGASASLERSVPQFGDASACRPRKPAERATACADALTMEKQDYRGRRQVVRVRSGDRAVRAVSDDMTLARWYPTLVGLRTARCWPSPASTTSAHRAGPQRDLRPETKQWESRHELQRSFPTYPALFLMSSGKLFYTGSNAGYGSDTVGPHPGHLGPARQHVPEGARAARAEQTETSGSVLLPPAQDQQFMIVGGGGVGESENVDGAHDVDRPDEARAALRARPGPARHPMRYPNLVDHARRQGRDHRRLARLPRARATATSCMCHIYDPKRNSLLARGRPAVGATTTPAALLLPGRARHDLGRRPALPGRGQHPARARSSSASRSTRRPISTAARVRGSRPVPSQVRRGSDGHGSSTPDAGGDRERRG